MFADGSATVIMNTILNGKIVAVSSATADNGKTVRVTGVYTGKVKTGTMTNGKAEFSLASKEKYKIELINTSGSDPVTEYTAYADLEAGGFREVNVGMDVATWQGLKNIVNAHLANEMVTIGHTMNVQLSSGELYPMEVYAVNHDPAYPHQIIIGGVNAMETGAGMNNSDTNAGGWNSCIRRGELNAGGFYTLLPDEVKAVISARKFKTSAGSQQNTLQESSDLIWLPREKEIFGTRTYAASAEDAEASQFAIFATAAKRIKTMGTNGAATYWWLSSPSVSYSTYFCGVYASGAAGYNNASYANGLVPCFHIIADDIAA